jgi:hypothetical protein
MPDPLVQKSYEVKLIELFKGPKNSKGRHELK